MILQNETKTVARISFVCTYYLTGLMHCYYAVAYIFAPIACVVSRCTLMILSHRIANFDYVSNFYRPRCRRHNTSRGDNTFGSVRVCACVSVRLSVGPLLFEPFDL